MRLLSTVSLSLLSIAGLAACQSEESYRAEIRGQALAGCRSGANPVVASQLSQVGWTPEQACDCAVDRYMRSASYEQLKRDANNPVALNNAMMQCVTDQTRRASAAALEEANREMGAATANASRAMEQTADEMQRVAAEAANAAAGR